MTHGRTLLHAVALCSVLTVAVLTQSFSQRERFIVHALETTRLVSSVDPGLTSLYDYRLAQLEKQMDSASKERQAILALLVGNLIALVISLVKDAFGRRRAAP